MNKISQIVLAATIFFVSSTGLACDYPNRPHIPNGADASKDQLLAAKAGVTEFLNAVDEYLRCIEAAEQVAIDELADPDGKTVQKRDTALNRKFDAANEEKALIGEQFNQQVRAYNAKRKQSQ